ncbi:15675_t:CDS:1, partial [Rhizophagus irregularis]
LQKDDDLILASGVPSWTNCPLSTQASELGLILHILRLLPRNSSITFYTKHQYTSLFSNFCYSSPERRVRSPYTSFGWLFIAVLPTP